MTSISKKRHISKPKMAAILKKMTAILNVLVAIWRFRGVSRQSFMLADTSLVVTKAHWCTCCLCISYRSYIKFYGIYCKRSGAERSNKFYKI